MVEWQLLVSSGSITNDRNGSAKRTSSDALNDWRLTASAAAIADCPDRPQKPSQTTDRCRANSRPLKKLALDFDTQSRLGVAMDDDQRNLINQLGSELAAILENASADAALLPGVDPSKLKVTLVSLSRAAADAQAIAVAMLSLARLAND